MLTRVGKVVRGVLDVFFIGLTIVGMAYSVYLSLLR